MQKCFECTRNSATWTKHARCYTLGTDPSLITDRIRNKSGKQYVSQSRRHADNTGAQKKRENGAILISPPSPLFDPPPRQMKRPVLPSLSLRRPARLVAEFSLGYLLSETTCVIGCRVQTTCVIGCRVQTTCEISSRVQTTCVIGCRVQTTCVISSRVQTTCVIGCRVQTTCVIGCRVQSSPLSNNPCDWLPSSVLCISETICVTGCRVQSCLSVLLYAFLSSLYLSVPVCLCLSVCLFRFFFIFVFNMLSIN